MPAAKNAPDVAALRGVLLLFLCVSSAASQDFGPPRVVTISGARGLSVSDVDGDGDPDILSSSSDTIAWFENLGGGSIGTQRVITSAEQGVLALCVADVDGDGDPDVLSAALSGIAWFENVGGGTFGSRRVILSSTLYEALLSAADLDGDGDSDALFGSPLGNSIRWFENYSFAGAFGPGPLITSDAASVSSVYPTDLDGDGDVDVLSASSGDGKIAWYENLGMGAFGPQQIIGSAVRRASSVYAKDLDGDGDEDVLSASNQDDEISWFENRGAGAFGPRQSISTNANGATSVFAADLDGDGDADVLSSSSTDDKLAWYENLGRGDFGAQRVITNEAESANSVHAADMDGDGYIDVVSGFDAFGKVAWFRNLSHSDCNGNGILDSQDIASSGSADCNGDGVPDECQIAEFPGLDIDLNGVIDGCEEIGERYCPAVVLNSSGQAGSVIVRGVETLLLDDITLTAHGLPRNSFGYFFTSRTQGFVYPVGDSQGALCVVGQIGRFTGVGQIMFSGPVGVFSLRISLQSMPTPMGLVMVAPGETWNFQAWHRDANPTPTSNFTDAVSVSFQ